MLLHCAKNERLRIIYVLLSGIALHCVDGLETSDQAFFNDVEKRTFPERSRSDLAVRASSIIGDFSVDAVLERPRHIIIRFNDDERWKAALDGKRWKLIIYVSVYGPGDVLLDQYSEEGRKPDERKVRVNDHEEGVYVVAVRGVFTFAGQVSEENERSEVVLPAAPPIEVSLERKRSDCVVECFHHNGACYGNCISVVSEPDCTTKCNFLITVKGTLPGEKVTFIEITLNSGRMERRWNDTYHLTTNLFHREEFRESIFFYHYGDYDMSYSVFDYIEFSFTPRRGEYRGRTTMTRAKKRPYIPHDPLKKVVKTGTTVTLRCGIRLSNEDKFVWEKELSDTLESFKERAVDNETLFFDGDLRVDIDFYDIALFRCLQIRDGYRLPRLSTHFELAPLQEAQLKPHLDVTILETRPRYFDITWNYSVPKIAAFREEEGSVVLSGNVSCPEVNYRYNIPTKGKMKGDHRLRVLHDENYLCVFEVVVNFTADIDVIGRTIKHVKVPRLDDIEVKNLTHSHEIEDGTVLVLLKWGISGLQPTEDPGYKLSLEIWQRKWLSNSTVEISPQIAFLHSLYTYEMDFKPFLKTSPRVRLRLSPILLKKGKVEYEGISTTRVVEILHNPLINVTELWVMNGTNVTIRCREPSDHYYWVYQEGYENTTKDINLDVSTLHIHVTRNERYRCYSKGSEYYRADEDVRLFPLEEQPDNPEVELRLERTQPPTLHIKWSVNWIVDAPISKRALIDIKEGNAVPARLEFAEKNHGEAVHRIQESNVAVDVIVTAYYNEYLNTSRKEEIVVQDIAIKNLQHKLESKQILLQWEIEGALPYEELKHFLSLEIWQRKWLSNSTFDITPQNTSLPSFHTYEMDLKPFFETSPRVRLHLSPVVNKYKGISASRVVEILQNPLINVTELWVMKGTNVTIRCREPSDHYYWVYQEGYESTTKDMSPDVSTLTIRVTRNERYRCYSKGIEYYRADEDVRLVPLEEPPDYPEVELRLERSLPPKLHIKWIANWIADAPMSKRALIDIKKRNAAPTRLEFAGKNDGEVEHQIDESKVEIVVIVTAYYNEYLNPSKEDKIVVQDILIKNLKHKLERKRIYLQWEVEGAQPYEKLNYLLRTKSRSNTTTKDVGNRTSAVLSFDRRIGNHTLAVRAKIDSYSGPISEEVSIFVPDVRVIYLRHKMHKNEIFLEWEVRGYLPFEEPSFILSIKSRGNTTEKDVGTAKSTVVQIDRRNREYELAVKAVVDSYEGPVTAASIHVPEFVLNRGPENLNVKVSAALISIEFEPVPANEFRMFGEDKGCKIIVCKEKEVSPKCVSQHAAPQLHNVEFHDLEEYDIYHATGECYTGAGAGPRSPWLLVVTGTVPIAEITAEEGLNLIISWSISTETGLPLNNSQIKNVEIAQFAKDEQGSYTHGLVVSKSKERQIDTGMSPAYKFDTGCYIFTLNATLRNKMTVFGKSSEICYTWTSPSFVILYTAILIILIAIAVMVFSNRKRKMKMSTTKPPPAKSTTTSKSSTSSTTKSTIIKKDKSLHKMEGKSKTPSETVSKAKETKGSKPPTKAKGDAKEGKK